MVSKQADLAGVWPKKLKELCRQKNIRVLE